MQPQLCIHHPTIAFPLTYHRSVTTLVPPSLRYCIYTFSPQGARGIFNQLSDHPCTTLREISHLYVQSTGSKGANSKKLSDHPCPNHLFVHAVDWLHEREVGILNKPNWLTGLDPESLHALMLYRRTHHQRHTGCHTAHSHPTPEIWPDAIRSPPLLLRHANQ